MLNRSRLLKLGAFALVIELIIIAILLYSTTSVSSLPISNNLPTQMVLQSGEILTTATNKPEIVAVINSLTITQEQKTPSETTEASITATSSLNPTIENTVHASPSPTEPGAVTPEVIPAEQLMTPAPPGAFSMVVANAFLADNPKPYPVPSTGKKWLVMVVRFENHTNAAVTIGAKSLILVDSAQKEIAAEIPDQYTQPPLIGSPIESQGFVLAIVRFAIDIDSEGKLLKWCEDVDCKTQIEAIIP